MRSSTSRALNYNNVKDEVRCVLLFLELIRVSIDKVLFCNLKSGQQNQVSHYCMKQNRTLGVPCIEWNIERML